MSGQPPAVREYCVRMLQAGDLHRAAAEQLMAAARATEAGDVDRAEQLTQEARLLAFNGEVAQVGADAFLDGWPTWLPESGGEHGKA